MAIDDIFRSRYSGAAQSANKREKEREQSQQADAAEVERFEQALQQRSEQRREQNASRDKSQLNDIFSELMSSMNRSGKGAGSADSPDSSAAALNQMFAGLMSDPKAAAGTGPESVTPPALKDELQSLSDKLVSQILASDPRQGQGSELRLTLSAGSGLLQGSEIVLRRDLLGMLAIEINCRNQEQFKKFVQLRPLLTESLERHEQSSVNFLLNDPQDPDGEQFTAAKQDDEN